MTDLAQVRALLGSFSPARPFAARPEVMRQLKADPALADLMDRVALSEPLPPAHRPRYPSLTFTPPHKGTD